jgi:hypothetical protein
MSVPETGRKTGSRRNVTILLRPCAFTPRETAANNNRPQREIALAGDIATAPILGKNGAVAVSKFRADVNVGGGTAKALPGGDRGEPQEPAPNAASAEPDVVTTVATIGVIGVAAALFDVALIPGIIIGVAAAYAPKYVNNLGDRLQPLFNSTVRTVYKATRSARDAVAEAQERMHDIAAEVDAEEAGTEAGGAAPTHAAS